MREITSLASSLVKRLVKLRKNSDYRDDEKSVVIEGKRLMEEVCPFSHVKLIVATHPALIPLGIDADETVLVKDGVFKKISGLETPEGVLAEVQKPEEKPLKDLKWLVALDGVGDPGNVGALLRSALALGWQGALLLPGTADPYNEKAIRASRGAVFRLPIKKGSWQDFDCLVKEGCLEPVVADLSGQPLSEVRKMKAAILILGNEAKGPSDEALSRARKVFIPMPGDMESLNVAVAGSILMYGLKADA